MKGCSTMKKILLEALKNHWQSLSTTIGQDGLTQYKTLLKSNFHYCLHKRENNSVISLTILVASFLTWKRKKYIRRKAVTWRRTCLCTKTRQLTFLSGNFRERVLRSPVAVIGIQELCEKLCSSFFYFC